ncbi:MAG: hypothetical protein C5B48_01820, partial [Candidatus Rokuibacteriota bacterium]
AAETAGPLTTGVETAPLEGTTSATRSGLLLGAASVAAIAANYAFLLATGRILGSEDYGSLAALIGLLTFVLLPAGALQMAVSREISRRRAGGDAEGADTFARATVRLALLATAPVLTAGFLLAAPLAYALKIHSVGVIVLTELVLVTALVFPVALGTLQGLERFYALAGLYVFPFALRLGLLAVFTAAGFRLGGALAATLLAQLVGMALALWLIHEPLRRSAGRPRPDLRPFLVYLGPVVVGLIGIAFLTQSDILVVKARFSGTDAGAYAAASAFARVAFFVPATILAVLFPRTAARHARGEDTRDILGRSLLVTAAFCVGLWLFYAAAGRGLVVSTFGADFAPGGDVLAPFALAIGLFSLAHVLVGYHLSRGETRFAWIVALAVVAQIVVLSVYPTSLRQVVFANLAVGAGLLVAHELLVGSSVPALRAGFRHFHAAAAAAVDLRVRRVLVEGAFVLLGSTLLVCALFWPLVTRIGTTVVGRGSDAAGGIGALWQRQHEGGYHLFGTMHHTLTGAPFGWSEGNGLNIQGVLPYYPAYLLTKVIGPVAAYNLVLLSAYVLSAASMYLLVRYLGCHRLVAAWAGVVFVVFPWHLARTPHASLAHLEFFPLLFLALIASARQPSWPRFLAVGLVTLACWLTAGYLGTMAVVAVGAFMLGVWPTTTRRRGALIFGGSLATALVATMVVALLSIVSGVGRGAGLDRVPGDLAVYGLRPLELVVPAMGNIVLGGRQDRLLWANIHGSNPTETSNYLGVLTMGLALVWIVLAVRGWKLLASRIRVATAGLLAVVVAALLFAAPSPVHVGGHAIWMPSRPLWEVIPAVRVPARWVAILMAALVPLSALALQAGWKKLQGLDRRGLAPVALVAGALTVSVLELMIYPARPRFSDSPRPAEYAAVSKTPPGILTEYPITESSDYLFWQTVHHRPLLNGPPVFPAEDVRRVLVDPAVPGTAARLSALGVTAMVTHANALGYRDGVPDVPDASWGSGYALVARGSDGASLWRVVAPPAPALVTLRGGFGDPSAPSGSFVGYPFESPSGVGALELWSKRPQVVRLAFDAVPPGGATRVLRIGDNQSEQRFTLGGRTHVSVAVQVPRGHSILLVKTDPPPQSPDDAILITAPRAESSSSPPVLHAQQISPVPGF